MTRRIGFSEVTRSTDPVAVSDGSSAVLLEAATVTLHFRLTSTDDSSLEALRYARRAMLREEWTRGVEEGEPSLSDAVFSAFDVLWPVPARCRERCRATLEELVSRANQALAELSANRRRRDTPGFTRRKP